MRAFLISVLSVLAVPAFAEPPPPGGSFTVPMPTAAVSGFSCPVAGVPLAGSPGMFNWSGCGLAILGATQQQAAEIFANFVPDGEALPPPAPRAAPMSISLAAFLARFTPAEIAAVQTANPALSILLAAGVAANGGLVDTTNADLVAALAQLPESVLAAARRAQILDLTQKSP